YVTPRETVLKAVEEIKVELEERLKVLRENDKLVEAQRLEQRTRFDIEMLVELGYCNGVENYSRLFSGRAPGEPPPTLFDYLPEDALLVIDESHVSVPQIGGMYKGDRSRKETLVSYGFRLPSALDNRPLKFEEWERLAPQMIFVSATPGPYEADHAGQVVEQVVLCLFPMEPAIYARHGVDARFVGHPLADAIPLEPDRAGAREALGIPFHAPVLAVLPGSRLGEIQRMLPVFLEAAAGVAGQVPGLQLVIPAATAACRASIEATIDRSPFPVPRSLLLDGQAQRAMIAADVVLLASGTAALEAMLCKRPMVVGHRIAPTTHRIVRGLGMLKSAHVSLPNVLAGEALVPELLQDDCTAPAL